MRQQGQPATSSPASHSAPSQTRSPTNTNATSNPTSTAPADGSEEEGPLPPLGAQWEFRNKTTEISQKILAGVEGANLSTGPFSRTMLQRMIRSFFMDKTIFREVASDRTLHGEAWKVAILIIILSTLGWQILNLNFLTDRGLIAMGAVIVIQIVTWLVRAWVIQFAAETWFHSKVNFRQLFRALAYAQTPVGLQIVPIVGQAVSIWALVTSTAAIQDVVSCNTKNAIILAIIGAVGVSVAAAVTTRIVWMLM